MTREEAIIKILSVMFSRMAMMSGSYDEALTLANDHNITADEMLRMYRKKVEKI